MGIPSQLRYGFVLIVLSGTMLTLGSRAPAGLGTGATPTVTPTPPPASTPTRFPTPDPSLSGFLCTAGARDGLGCFGDDDCPGGVCVIPFGVCSGGVDDGLFCDCPSATCSPAPVCDFDPAFGTCTGGVFDELCCDITFNCVDGAPCVPAHRVCSAGESKGFPCLTDGHCPGSACISSGRFCAGGDFESFSCVDDADCFGGDCLGVLRDPFCTGDCNTDGTVTVDELIVGVNLILVQAPLSTCLEFDANDDRRITIEELVRAVGFLLNGCGA